MKNWMQITWACAVLGSFYLFAGPAPVHTIQADVWDIDPIPSPTPAPPLPPIPDPAPAPPRPVVVPIGTPSVTVGEKTVCNIDGQYVVVESRKIFAEIDPDGAEHVSVNQIRQVEIDGVKLNMVVAGEIELVYPMAGGTIGVVAGPGRYQAKLATGRFTSKTIIFDIGGKPEPDPDVDPPDPVTDAPFESDGFAVVVVVEKSQLPTIEQTPIFTSGEIHSFLKDKAVKLDDDRAFYRFWDDDYEDEDLDNVPAPLRDAYKKVREDAKELPWIAISTGKSGYSGPLPGSVQEMMDLLKKYAPR